MQLLACMLNPGSSQAHATVFLLRAGDQGDGSPAGAARVRKAQKAAGRKAAPPTVKAAATKLGLPPVVTTLLAAAQQKQVCWLCFALGGVRCL